MNKCLKSYILIVFLIVSICLTFTNVFAHDSVPHSLEYKTVQVGAGDSLWSIAGKYATNKEDIREIIAAINKINHLDSNSKIYPGQTLKIPITRK